MVAVHRLEYIYPRELRKHVQVITIIAYGRSDRAELVVIYRGAKIGRDVFLGTFVGQQKRLLPIITKNPQNLLRQHCKMVAMWDYLETFIRGQ